jgi:hypothetical protein
VGAVIIPERRVPLLCLDLDSTVRKGKSELGRFVHGPGDVEVFPEAVEMMRRWKNAGGRIIGVSNQGGVANGEIYPPYMGLMVGDRPEDQECARLAGLDFQWAADWRSQAGKPS